MCVCDFVGFEKAHVRRWWALVVFATLASWCWGGADGEFVRPVAGEALPRIAWLLYGLIASVAVFVVIVLALVGRIGRRLADIEKTLANGAPADRGGASVESVTQSKVFAETVQQMIHVYAERFLVSSKGECPATSPAAGELISQSSLPTRAADLTETETGLLFDLMEAAIYRAENSCGDGVDSGQTRAFVCTLFLSEINQQYQQQYTRNDCDSLARKMVALTQSDADPILAAGGFLRVRFIRENVAVDFDTRVIEGLRKRFS